MGRVNLVKRGGKVVPLNLVTTYPVHWSRFRVLRDFLQNFFDAVPHEEFASRVEVESASGAVEIRAAGVEFSHQWLVAIGASTKTASKGSTKAGYFGEGFKVASLCAVRDWGWRVMAGSGDWRLEVTTTPLVIDGVGLESLAYRIWRGDPGPSRSWLRIENIDAADARMLETAVCWSFLYPGNPLLGDCIHDGDRVALYPRSAIPLPANYPGRREAGSSDRGILFAAHQARGRHELPFGVALHARRDENRDRDDYYDFQVIDALADAAYLLPAEPALRLLEACERRWNERRPRRFATGSWEPVVRQLAESVSRGKALTRAFRGRHPNLLVVEALPRYAIAKLSRRSEARAWAHSHGPWRLVQPGFLALGYPTLEDACAKAGGFLQPVQPTEEEARRIELLLGFVRRHFTDLLSTDALPVVEVKDARRPGRCGEATVEPLRGGPYSSRGWRVRYRVRRIGLLRRDLARASPHAALATMLHEFAHAFGGEGSSSFTAVLTDLIERVASLQRTLAELGSHWTSPAPNRQV